MIGALCRTILRPVRFIFERVLALPLAIKAEKMSSPRYLSLGLNVVVAVLLEPDHGHVQGSTLGVDKDKVALSPL